jgi:TatD DNase family protein
LIGLKKILITAGQVEEIENALNLIEKYDDNVKDSKQNFLFTTVGIHPTRCSMFEHNDETQTKTMDDLKKHILNDRIVAIGEVK